ncbi:hypothetical protein [Crocosphaera chwakensis]|uniref:Biopolymer transport protein ExbD/TolR n=1 Tax=Crocosphaera chwakensis CCY0110 TaxID=391612 RepID=A3IR06_9CHRO|nr:hypothetical protein [Crocosphaera chwakensis]EAZ90996.1 hypothetical protein CY0110_27330 [Crocosphaera chwakensis CCY0110]
MRRRSFSKNSLEVELFPFLSILACTIGTLILLIIVLTTQLLKNEREITIIAKQETTGENQGKIPKYIECRQDGVLLHPSQVFVPKSEIDNRRSPLNQLIQEVQKNKDKQYLIVVLRPQGIDVFQQVRDIVEERGIDIGYEPIDQDWKLKIEEAKNNEN